METSIRFVRVSKRADKFGVLKPALCFRGREKCHAVINDDSGIRTLSNIALADLDRAPIVAGPNGFGHLEYPIDLFVKRFDEIGSRKGITQRAKFLLARALGGGIKESDPLPPEESEAATEPDSFSPKAAPYNDRKVKPKPAPAPATPGAPKPRSPASESRTSGSDLIRKLSAELNLAPPKLRKLLRSKGLSAPYTDEKMIRGKLK